jgi:5-methylthioadenosine/S-adenosylhomocysteine deaminase
VTIDLLVHGPHVLTLSGEGVGYRSDFGIAVDRGRIIATGQRSEISAQYAAERTIDADGRVILPGLIDAHMHTGLALLRGLAQDTRNWMMQGLGPFHAQLDPARMDAGSRLAIVEGLRAGTRSWWRTAA